MRRPEGKQKVLVVGYLPPPEEGTAKITEVIINSEELRQYFYLKFLELRKRSKANERGKFAFANILNNFLNFLDYIHQLIKYQPQIVYLPLAQNKFGFLRDSLFILLGKFMGKKICVHFHGGNFDLFYQQQNFPWRCYIGWVLGKIDRLILLAEKFKKQFYQFITEEKISVLYNCVPNINSQMENNRQQSSKNEMLRILFIGYLSKAKGAVDLVHSVPIVISNYKKPIEFILCGQPIDTEQNITFIPEPHFGYSKIKKFIKDNNIEKHIKIYTNLSPTEKHKLFCTSDIFVFPTYSEGCGLVALEAMSYGLPVITTPVGALEEMLTEGENCLFVAPGDFQDLAQKILMLIESESLRQKMSFNNLKLMKDKFSPKDFCLQMENIWLNMS